MSNELVLRIYDRSISTGEHRDLHKAIEAAHKDDTLTYVSAYPGQRAAIVPEAVALWWETYVNGGST